MGETTIKVATEASRRGAPIVAKNVANYFVNKKMNGLNKKFAATKGSCVTLTNNITKDITKIISLHENRH